MVDVLIGVQDIGASFVEQRGDAGHQAAAVGAIDQQNGGIFHVQTSLRHGPIGDAPEGRKPECLHIKKRRGR